MSTRSLLRRFIASLVRAERRGKDVEVSEATIPAIRAAFALVLGEVRSLDELVAEVARLRGREISLHEYEPFDGEFPYASQWFAWEHHDVIMVHPVESELYRQKCVCHELAHMLLGHPPQPMGHRDICEEQDADVLGGFLLRLLIDAARRVSTWEEVFE